MTVYSRVLERGEREERKRTCPGRSACSALCRSANRAHDPRLRRRSAGRRSRAAGTARWGDKVRRGEKHVSSCVSHRAESTSAAVLLGELLQMNASCALRDCSERCSLERVTGVETPGWVVFSSLSLPTKAPLCRQRRLPRKVSATRNVSADPRRLAAPAACSSAPSS